MDEPCLTPSLLSSSASGSNVTMNTAGLNCSPEQRRSDRTNDAAFSTTTLIPVVANRSSGRSSLRDVGKMLLPKQKPQNRQKWTKEVS